MAAGRIRWGSCQCAIHCSGSGAIRDRAVTKGGHCPFIVIVTVLVVLVFVDGPAGAFSELVGRHRGNKWLRTEPILHMARVAAEDGH